ncbi:MAG: PKD domain-containing protein [Chryseolinea sp.]
MKSLYKSFYTAIALAVILLACSDDGDGVSEFPTSVELSYSVAGKQAAFTALSHSVDSYTWDFGDGQTSTEKDPVHVYTSGGYYTVTVRVTGKSGTDEKTAQLAVDVTPYILLTGGPTAASGKTWKIDSSHPSGDKFAFADDSFTSVQALSTGVFSSIGYPEAYDDSFTFYFDGKYTANANGAPSSDGKAFGGYVNALFTGASGVKAVDGVSDVYDLCTYNYTSDANATFTHIENEDFAVPSIAGVTYSDVSTLSFTGGGYVGFLDAQTKVILQSISDKSMRLVIFIAADPGKYPKASHALVMTFKAV